MKGLTMQGNSLYCMTYGFQHDENWRNWINESLKQIAKTRGRLYCEIKAESYQLLEERGGCYLENYLVSLWNRLKRTGASRIMINRTNRLDAIEADTKLREIYTMIIKEMLIQYVI
jgi:hypothetical protein